MDILYTPQQEKTQFKLNSLYLQQIVTQGKNRYENDFEEIELLIDGGFYKIYKVLNKIDQQFYAVKKIEIHLKQKQLIEVNVQRVIKEVRYMAQLNHPNIMRYYNSWIEMIESQESQEELLSPLKIPFNLNAKLNKLGDLFTYSNPQQPLDTHTSLDRLSYSEAESSDSDSNQELSDKQLNDQKKINQKITRLDQHYKSYGQHKDIEKIMIFIQTEFCEQSLERYINNRNKQIFKVTNNQEQLNKILIQHMKNAFQISMNLISALEYIHQECKLVHRDLQPSNIFLNNENDIRIGDFGLMKKIKQLLAKTQKIEDYQFGYIKEEPLEKPKSLFQAPEQISGNIFKQYDPRIDIYTLGLILLVLYYPTKTEIEIISIIQEAKTNGILPNRMNESIRNIISCCIQQDPNKRINIQQVKQQLQDAYSQGSTTDMEIKKLGFMKVQFEDEEQITEKYFTLVAKQLHLYKNIDSTKAQAIYDLSECNMEVQDNNNLLIISQSLVSITLVQLTETQLKLLLHFDYI